ncbi:MAG: right-handed parallel beta-helix repeat-containing protein [Sedimentisphaerales bacterium]|nr:right-handed parallel beta-helix repeat-containing protein [Sedimentisphaerales bacterium]
MKAQPSGGPYGPLKKIYDLPDVSGKIYYVAPGGDAENQGEILTEPTTLEKAIERVVTGDAIVMRGGTYRTGHLLLNQGIIIQPYKDERPVLKGTFVATDWQDLHNGLWKTTWLRLFPGNPDDWWRRNRHGKNTPLHRFNNDMVFVDGKFLQSAGWEGEVDRNSYYINYETGEVFIGEDPTDRLVEITAFNIAVNRITGECHGKTSDHRGPVIRGITFTQYAYRALEVEGTYPNGLSDESEHGKEVIGTTLEHCEISNCSRVAAYLRGDSLTVRHCKVSHTSTEGLYIMSSADVLLEKNIFTQNNIEKITGYYPAAVKIFNQCYRATCTDNLVIDLPYSSGIWYDVGNVDGIFVNNWVQNVGSITREYSKNRFWPTNNGFFFEISKRAICAGNVFVNCDQGIYVINSSDVHIYQNTLINSTVTFARTPRSAEGDHFGWHPSTGPDVDEREGHLFINNLLAVNENYIRPLFVAWQTSSLCDRLTKPQLSQLDYNVYVRSSDNLSKSLIQWSPIKNRECQLTFDSLQDLRKLYPEFSANSRYLLNYQDPIFKSDELGNYQLLPSFPGAEAAAPLPEEIKERLRCSERDSRFAGAFPPLK